jgi:D-alanyl-lipoteichoic acid acyltransferase DltB (MBOAT superfamily)
MLFNSAAFLIFFPVVTAIFYLLPHKFRWLLLLAASCYFYMYFIPVYMLILAGTILIDYQAGILIGKSKTPRRRKTWLWLSIAANIGILAVFKYYNFFLDNANWIAESLSGNPLALRYLGIALPIGLSFHTFQALSYTFEVYYKRQEPERHFGIYALYVMFYPQLVAGPIERPQNILPQFHNPVRFSMDNLRMGLCQMCRGMFKKVVIADNLSGYVDMAFTDPEQHSGPVLLLAAYMFTVQIYCDFSGYSDIALGAARCMGYKLMDNFNLPLTARSIRDFWSRWHISLSTWFRDYLYIPLGGKKSGLERQILNLFIVFMVSGLWHGASWNFVIWGALHGLFIAISLLVYEARGRKPATTGITGFINLFITIHLVVFSFIFFRAATLPDALAFIEGMAGWINQDQSLIQVLGFYGGEENRISLFVTVIALTVLFLLIDPFMERIMRSERFQKQPVSQLLFQSVLAGSILLLGFFGEIDFIYFQF